jgi:hypothetical protein
MVKTAKEIRVIHLQLICVNPPLSKSEQQYLLFGLQDRHQDVHPGQQNADGSISYELDIPVTRNTETDTVRFTGPYIHGIPAKPFLYLSLKRVEMESASWIRRLKIPLPSLAWKRIEGTTEKIGFVARIAGSGSGMVPLLGEGWIQEDPSST